tara:strand:+ start:58 stop:639 length:582 start_codon:yes stop_codon:yes gene_type:complete
MRHFAIVGHRAPSSGNLNLNDLAGSGGRMDVLARAISSALFLSHGIREDTTITLHLMGGPGVSRRIRFNGAKVKGLHVDERAIAGRIRSVISDPVPARGLWVSHGTGIEHSGGDLETTLNEWRNSEIRTYILSKDAPQLSKDINQQEMGFILSDDLPFNPDEEKIITNLPRLSLGERWLQGHIAIAIVHHILD